MKTPLMITRLALALCVGGIAGALLSPALLALAGPDGFRTWGLQSYFLFAAYAAAVTVPMALWAGALACSVLRFVPPGLRTPFFVAVGGLSGLVLCLVTSGPDLVVFGAAVGLWTSTVSRVLIPTQVFASLARRGSRVEPFQSGHH